MSNVKLQSEITAEEKAIALLTGQSADAISLETKLHAQLVLAEQRLKASTATLVIADKPKPAPVDVATGNVSGAPHGDRFPDVSMYQASVNLLQVLKLNENIRVGKLIVMKATEGIDYVDSFLASRWHGAALAGFPFRGAYHFLHPSMSPTEQAAHFLNAITEGGREIHAQDILICDCEVSDGESASVVASCTKEFGAYVAAHAPAKRWLYGGAFLHENGVELAPYNGHWLAAYTTDPTPYYYYGCPVAWQYSDGVNGPVPHSVVGIGSCDMSIVM
jgi:lysozyme